MGESIVKLKRINTPGRSNIKKKKQPHTKIRCIAAYGKKGLT